MKKQELVFIPLAASSHLTGSIQFAKSLLDQNENLSITVLIILLPPQKDLDPYTKSVVSSNNHIKFIIIPSAITNHLPQSFSSSISVEMFVHRVFESHKPQVEHAIMDLVSDDSTQIVGFVLDMFSSCMIDVANKFMVPSYMFCSFSTAFLGFLLHLPDHHNRVGVNFHPSDSESVIPSYQNHVPANVLPGAVFDKSGGGYESYVYFGTRLKECKGFIVNSFAELEPYALNSILTPPNVYPVGPLIDLKNRNDSSGSTESEIRNWLDNQPLKSVLFLCFGTMGYFNESQLEQMAIALERSGHRFLWSIRQPPRDGNVATSDHTNVQKVLPDGFLERVKERGMVCGWAPQAEVLAHGAVKGFVSHCGWNSILESLWYNVPIATWPLHAEQQLNAFLLVKELELAVELSLSYRSHGSEVVMADQIQRAINSLMDDANPVREKVKDISEKGRNAMIKGGSSFVTLEKLVQDMLHNIIKPEQ
ncbi:anthocyanidin 3-O-glucosyltransferase 6-like [Bidens hawaiensis]|uniref:anthocyanidin 3-O-glucosyltransferase 6-like n=1 Tax=Bidens hawaiensis TaxID=980011 RepID=UPI00404A3815